MEVVMSTLHSWRRTLLSPIALIAAATAQAAEPAFDRELARNPPRIAHATLQLLPRSTETANAVLRVQFADQRRQSAIVIDGGKVRTYLRDDGVAPDAKVGDGVYAAFVHVNTKQYSVEQRRRLQLAQNVKELPEFDNRELIRWTPFRPSDDLTLRTDRPSVLDRFKGVPFVVDPWRELLITDVDVVEDPGRTYDACTGVGTPMGPWTFGRLMTEMANEPVTGIRPGDFVEHWLQEWTEDQVINGWTVHDRAMMAQDYIDAWPRLPDGQLDLAQAPFRLLAIVNRLDLRENTVYGGASAGEARFVFGFLDCHDAHPLVPDMQESTVILEYGIDKSGCLAVRNWAQQWKGLGAHALGSPAYNAALQAITDQFSLANADLTQTPNRSAINQVRTNETFFFIPHWQLREAKLCSTPACAGQLEHATIAQTPHVSLQNTTTLRNYINNNAGLILAGAHVVPLSFPLGVHFRGGEIQPGAGFAWNHAGVIDLEARHEFSKATCSGCHTKETGTQFVHIANRPAGAAAELSDFLTGADMPKTDPVSGVPRTFHDLLDRQAKLDATANMICVAADDFAVEDLFMQHQPPAFVH
jgi:hypothetical protein